MLVFSIKCCTILPLLSYKEEIKEDTFTKYWLLNFGIMKSSSNVICCNEKQEMNISIIYLKYTFFPENILCLS